MPSVSSKFNNTLSVSNFTNLDNLLEEGTGDATFTNNADGTFQGFSVGTGPNLIPSTATLVGIQFFVTVTPSAGSLNFTFTPKKGATTSGNAQTGTYSGAQTKTFGGSSELFGLTFSTINDIASFRLRLQFTSVAGTATLNSSSNQLRPTFHYTLPDRDWETK